MRLLMFFLHFTVPSPPPKRQMLANVHEERHTPRIRQIGVFRVLSYNVLAELYATRQLYPYCPMWVLSWNFRKELLKNELHSYNADILCLQVCWYQILAFTR